jgi:Phage tail tube protein
MPIAVGVAKQLRYKAETTWGVAPGAAGAQSLRRVSSNLSLAKQTYQSAEILSTYQLNDFRHGVRSVEGSINGELSPGTYEDFIAAAVRRAFATVTAITGASITIAGTGPTYTVTRAAGSFLTDGLKIGQVIRLSVGTFNAANLLKNLFIVALTATVATVIPVNGVAMFAEGPIATSTVTVIGKTTYAPTSGHVDTSFAIEHYFSDLDETELFLGCKINRMAIDLPPAGIATIAMDMMGKDMTALSTAAAPYYTSPTAETVSGVLAAVNGIVTVGGVAVASLTGLNININGNMTAEPVVGSNVYPDIFEGRVLVDGQFTAFFESVTMRDLFLNETEVGLSAVFSTSNSGVADFIAFSTPRIKVGSASKDDGEKGIVQTFQFQALYNAAGGAGTSTEQTTLAIQDSLA